MTRSRSDCSKNSAGFTPASRNSSRACSASAALSCTTAWGCAQTLFLYTTPLVAFCGLMFTRNRFRCILNMLLKLPGGTLETAKSGSRWARYGVSMASASRMATPRLPSHCSRSITTSTSPAFPLTLGSKAFLLPLLHPASASTQRTNARIRVKWSFITNELIVRCRCQRPGT